MKIIEEKLPWWVGKEITCAFCQSKFLIEKGDSVQIQNGQNGKTNYIIDCPVCKQSKWFAHD